MAISIAVSATLRNGTGSDPTPTLNCQVDPSTAAAEAIPLSRKQSSHNHSCTEFQAPWCRLASLDRRHHHRLGEVNVWDGKRLVGRFTRRSIGLS